LIAQPATAGAEGDRHWQACTGVTTTSNDKVATCSEALEISPGLPTARDSLQRLRAAQ
jgi:hypothetical protein